MKKNERTKFRFRNLPREALHSISEARRDYRVVEFFKGIKNIVMPNKNID